MKKNAKKLTALGLAAVMCAALLAGCKGKDGQEAKTADGKTQLTIGIWDEKQRPALESMIESYTETHDNVEIGIETTPYKGGEYWTKLEAAATGGTAPDIFWINVLHAEDYYEGGILKDLSGTAEEMDLGTNFPEALVSAYNMGGKQIAIPKDFDTHEHDHFDCRYGSSSGGVLYNGGLCICAD